MPFESESQRKYLYANEPDVAQEFEDETPEGADLPEYKPMNQGGIAGDWQDELAGQLEQRYGKPQSMANGGFAGSPYDVDTGGSTTIQGISPDLQAPSGPPVTPSPYTVNPKSALPLLFNPTAGLPPAPVAPAIPSAPVTSAVSPTQARPSAPIGPDPLQSYLATQKQRLNRYGPDEQMELEQSLDKQRRGFLPNLALAGTGLADALMQGVARAGSGGFQANLQNRMDKTQEGQRQAFESGRAGHLARMKQDMEFAQIDPESPLSRSVQRANSQTLKLMGYKPEDIAMISASSMSDVLSKRLSLEEIRAEQEAANALREQQADYQRKQLLAAEQKRLSDEKSEKLGQQISAAKELVSKGPENAKFLGLNVPWTKSPTPASKAGERFLSEQINPTPSFESEEDAEAAGLQPGTVITIGGRPARVK